MKNVFKLLMLALFSAFALASCEDVPEPYPNPNGENGGETPGEDVVVEPAGTGTLADPYNVAAIVALINDMESGAESTQAYYIKGKVKSNSTTESTISQYGNMSFDMIDEGNTSTVFKAFQVYGPGNKKFTSVDQIKEGDEVVVYGKVVNYQGNTPETVGKGAAYVYSINSSSEPGTDPVTPVEVKGTGTEADPYNVAGVVAYCQSLGADVNSENEVYVKGKVSANNTSESTITSYGNMTFTMIDEGNTSVTFTAFQVYGPGKQKFTAASQIKEGDEVVVCGKVVNYKGNTPETVGKGASYVVSINGKSDDTGGNNGHTSTGDGDEVTVAEALTLIATLTDAGQTDKQYTVVGKIESITEISTQYGNATFVLEGGLTIFRCKDIGNVNFTDENRLKVGDEVKVQGYLKKYVKDEVVTSEVVNGQLISINGNTEGSSSDNNPGDNTGGNTGGETVNDGSKVITFVVGEDKGTCTSSAAGADQMSKNGITIVVTKGALANTDNYRTYKNETMTITSSATNIISVEFTCTADDNVQYGPGNFTTDAGNYTYSGKIGTWTGDAASVSLKATAAQVRATKIVVTLK